MGKTGAQPVQLVSRATKRRMWGVALCAALAVLAAGWHVLNLTWQVGYVWVEERAASERVTGEVMLRSVSIDKGDLWRKEMTAGAEERTVPTELRVVRSEADFWPGVSSMGWRGERRTTVAPVVFGLGVFAGLLLLYSIGRRARQRVDLRCGVCGYNLGTEIDLQSVCPECGERVGPAAASRGQD